MFSQIQFAYPASGMSRIHFGSKPTKITPLITSDIAQTYLETRKPDESLSTPIIQLLEIQEPDTLNQTISNARIKHPKTSNVNRSRITLYLPPESHQKLVNFTKISELSQNLSVEWLIRYILYKETDLPSVGKAKEDKIYRLKYKKV